MLKPKLAREIRAIFKRGRLTQVKSAAVLGTKQARRFHDCHRAHGEGFNQTGWFPVSTS
ncbi:hypothetical protein [Mesorhizobium neociceri]|uniref:Uncharacterized protein n=1 Tax=Mesorhizobium neociceri TaxID=1307853 RepID=A0A838B6P3_9HYPH|nr:hypothetical protein [Mesorhizobium neociceri]MBA1142458.1 hypothetical protein [Mesorhizobium neociceri]